MVKGGSKMIPFEFLGSARDNVGHLHLKGGDLELTLRVPAIEYMGSVLGMEKGGGKRLKMVKIIINPVVQSTMRFRVACCGDVRFEMKAIDACVLCQHSGMVGGPEIPSGYSSPMKIKG